ncbi:preprotein translocase subunit SecG [Candidatus Dependentiae bacterium]|nr:preprotein translocase subunit SecG [Candidatus Dependentiae bacterium]
MWYGLLVTLFVMVCVLLILIILVQKTKGGMGLGSIGGGTQMLFGGSGGQDLFQKITWVMTALFMGGSLLLAVLKRPTVSGFLSGIAQQVQPAQTAAPISEPASNAATPTDATSSTEATPVAAS